MLCQQKNQLVLMWMQQKMLLLLVSSTTHFIISISFDFILSILQIHLLQTEPTDDEMNHHNKNSASHQIAEKTVISNMVPALEQLSDENLMVSTVDISEKGIILMINFVAQNSIQIFLLYEIFQMLRSLT